MTFRTDADEVTAANPGGNTGTDELVRNFFYIFDFSFKFCELAIKIIRYVLFLIPSFKMKNFVFEKRNNINNINRMQ